jgi:hypothetical protein
MKPACGRGKSIRLGALPAMTTSVEGGSAALAAATIASTASPVGSQCGLR